MHSSENITIFREEDISTTNLLSLVSTLERPAVFKGLVSDWPLVRAARTSAIAAQDYLLEYYNHKPVVVYHAPPETKGKVFYNENYNGFNFQRGMAHLKDIFSKINEAKTLDAAPAYYVGSTNIDAWMPGFRKHNELPLSSAKPLVSLWLGNQSDVAPHYDYPENIACVVAGKRQFTLFPPEQLSNLYIGPLDFTPSGRALSMADIYAPDFTRFPKLKDALAHSISVTLEAGDALYIPSMWWHAVRGLENFNALVNYWWKKNPALAFSPEHVFEMALISLRNLPESEKKSWEELFSHYIFHSEPEHVAHIPDTIQGILNPDNKTAISKFRLHLLDKIK